MKLVAIFCYMLCVSCYNIPFYNSFESKIKYLATKQMIKNLKPSVKYERTKIFEKKNKFYTKKIYKNKF